MGRVIPQAPLGIVWELPWAAVIPQKLHVGWEKPLASRRDLQEAISINLSDLCRETQTGRESIGLVT